jgi:hypothetical protein
MATQNLQLTLPAFNTTNWNQPLNSNWAILDAKAGASISVSVTAADYILKISDLQSSRIQIVGNHGGSNINVVFPDGIGGVWIVSNGAFTSGGKLFVRTATYTTNPVEIPVTKSLLIFSDGVNLGTISLSQEVLDSYLKLSGGTITGELSLNKPLAMQPYPDKPPSSKITDNGQNVGFYNDTGSARAIMDLFTGKWTATGGVGIGASGPVAAALATFCPSAVYPVSGDPHMKGVAIEDVLVKLVEEIASLKAQLASRS